MMPALQQPIRFVSVLLISLLLVPALLAQPQPCGPNPAMTPTCAEACVICDINGFTGINNSTTQGEAPPGFCTTVVHHMQWIAFIAGSTSLTIQLKCFNCNTGQGLEAGIYGSLDCNNYQLVSNCDTDIQGGETATFTTTVPLVIGQYYYFVMDGNQGDICNYLVTVTSGTTLVPPLPAAGAISGSTNPCVGQEITYNLPPITGANFYDWKLDGQLLAGHNPSVKIDWTQPGVHELCVTAYNVCDTVTPVCIPILVEALPPTAVQAAICPGDCYTIGSNSFCLPGQYTVQLSTPDGCDSIVNLSLGQLIPDTTQLNITICQTETVQVGNQTFSQSGNYNIILQNSQGCDSLIILNLTQIPCFIHADVLEDTLLCHGNTDGILRLTLLDGTGPYTYTWSATFPGGPSGQGTLAQTNGVILLNNLPEGLYAVSITDADGKSGVVTAHVSAPTALGIQVQRAQYGDYNISCAGNADGSLTLAGQGGTPPYSYQWIGGNTQPVRTQLPAGAYIFTLTDAHGCTLVDTATLQSPAPLSFAYMITEPGCLPASGAIVADQVLGGQIPYMYALDSMPFSSNEVFGSLVPGTYLLTVQDANGCTATQTVTLHAPPTQLIYAGADQTIVLGDSVRMDATGYPVPMKWAWTPAIGLSCTDCPEPWARPFTTTQYILTATPEIGCPASDTVTITVDPQRDVYVPNVFKSNDDGRNDHLTVYTGISVSRVLRFAVYSRWGELVFEKENFQPNDESLGWDGTFRGQPMSPGVFAWVLEVEYWDGFSVRLTGDATLMR